MNDRPLCTSLRTSFLTLGFTILLLGNLASAAAGTEPGCLTLRHLKHLSACELTRLFDDAPPGEIPVGFARGQVLLMTSSKTPRLSARLAGSVWKGKHFADDGTFINQWIGFQALESRADLGTSWYDGKPCIVIEYPPHTPVFGNNRDEIREIAPGLYLARLYDRCPCPQFKGYFAFQIECSR